MAFKSKRVSFLANVVAKDNEPLLDTVDVSNTIRDISEKYPEDVDNYKELLMEVHSDPYIFFRTNYFDEYRKEEQKESERLKGPDLNELPDSVYSCKKCKSKK